MKIKAVHEIILAVEGKRREITPGEVVELPKAVVDEIPESAFSVVEHEEDAPKGKKSGAAKAAKADEAAQSDELV